MLEGQELSGKIGDAGTYSVDVTDKGEVTISASIDKDLGYGKITATLAVHTNILAIAEQIAAKTTTTLDDQAIAALEKLLGIVK